MVMGKAAGPDNKTNKDCFRCFNLDNYENDY